MVVAELRRIDGQEKLLSRESLAERWECSVDVIDRMREDGLPSIRWGRKFLRFRYSECVAWLERQQEAA